MSIACTTGHVSACGACPAPAFLYIRAGQLTRFLPQHLIMYVMHLTRPASQAGRVQVQQRLSTMVNFWAERKVFRKATLEGLRHGMVHHGALPEAAKPAEAAEAPTQTTSQPHVRGLDSWLHCALCVDDR